MGKLGASTAATDLQVKKKKEIFGILLPAAFMELSDGARAAVAVLSKSMYLVYSIPNRDSCSLIEEHGVD